MRHELRHLQGPTDGQQVLERWLREAATILQGIRYYAEEYRPFDEMETASVSLLLGAAASAGYYPVAEYRTTKLSDKTKQKSRISRGDLWFVAGSESYAFEFKRAWDVSTTEKLKICLEAAVGDINRMIDDEADHYYAVVAAPFMKGCDRRTYDNFADADWIGTIGAEKPEAYFYFKKVT